MLPLPLPLPPLPCPLPVPQLPCPLAVPYGLRGPKLAPFRLTHGMPATGPARDSSAPTGALAPSTVTADRLTAPLALLASAAAPPVLTKLLTMLLALAVLLEVPRVVLQVFSGVAPPPREPAGAQTQMHVSALCKTGSANEGAFQGEALHSVRPQDTIRHSMHAKGA